jgi:hypothetical protein
MDNASVTGLPASYFTVQGSANAKAALYYLDFVPSVQNQSGRVPDKEPAHSYSIEGTVPGSIIQKAFYTPDPKSSRHAVSLPMPDSISTYTGK